MTVYLYTSTEYGAPQLKPNTAGSFISVLDACLVNGFNSQAIASITVSGVVATITATDAHNYRLGDWVEISGASIATFNDQFQVTKLYDTGPKKFDIVVPAGTAAPGGTMTVKRPGAGWTKPYSGGAAAKAVYRGGTNSTGVYYRVDDSAPTGYNTAVSLMKMYESMSDVDTGTNRAPIKTGADNGHPFVKGIDVASTYGSYWFIAATPRAVLLLIDHAYLGGNIPQNGTTTCMPYFFGDYIEEASMNNYAALIYGLSCMGITYNNPASWSAGLRRLGIANADNNLSLMRAVPQLPGAGQSNLFSGAYMTIPGGTVTCTAIGGSNLIYPNPGSNVHYADNLYIGCIENGVRGRLPGIVESAHAYTGYSPLAVYNDLMGSGRDYMYHPVSANGTSMGGGFSNPQGGLFIDITGPWF